MTCPEERRGRERRGRADIHIHTLASDGVSSVAQILDAAEAQAELDVIAITDHERIDAAQAARAMARDRRLRVEVIVGEEISTRGGHLLALFMEQRIPPWRSLRSSIARVHEQGGLAIVAHPLVPYPLCATGRSIRRLFDDPDALFRPDAIEAFNPTTAGMRWGRQVPAFVAELGGVGVGGSDAHRAADVGHAVTTFPGRTADEMRAAILEGTTGWDGTAYSWRKQLGTFRGQLSKNALAVRDTARHRLLHEGLGRDLGYPR
jgi:predicted metal-dependent phosphoesterase TrpH